MAKTPTRVNYITDARAAAGSLFGGIEVLKEIDANRVGDQSTSAPTSEIGAPAAFGIQPWSQMWLGDPLETVPALQWPASVQTYAAMMTDSQIDGLLLGSTLPIRRYKWFFNPNGCDPKQVKALAADFNLPLEGEKDMPRGRLKKRFVHDRHMFHAFKAMGFGFYNMEIVGEYHEQDNLWHLTKLSPRPPLTIMDFALDRSGELLGIRQNITQPGIPLEPIPRSRLACYVWEQEGANYTGRAMIRSLYKNWMIKDRLLRVDALKHERNGMGVPWATGAPNMGKAELAALNQAAQRLKAGDTSGAVGPSGSDMKLLGVQGALPDTIASVNYHDEAMSRRFLMMFLQLGSTVHGSRALGSEFIDYFQLAQESIANWYRDATNEDVVEQWWDWNYGETDTVPILEYKRDDDPRVALESLDKMVKEGVVRVDDELEERVREAMDLPKFKGPARELLDPPEIAATNPGLTETGDKSLPESAPGGGEGTSPAPSPASSAPGEAKARRHERTVAALGDPPLPNRSLRRQIYTQESESKVNLAALDSIWMQARDTLFANWKEQITNAQIDELVEEIGKTSDITKLSALEAAPSGQLLLEEGMTLMYNQGVQLAAQEYEDQGLGKPKLPEATPDFAVRASAIDNVAARTLSNMASSRALSVSGGNLTKAQVADHVHSYLDSLTQMMLRDRISGALTAAMNDGRRALMASSEAPARYYSSEILDVNTCSACASVDGTQYESLDETEQDYPGGGYVNCEGGDRCRGTIIAVYAEANTRTEEDELES